MRVVPTGLDGAYVIELDLHEDERGFFARTWCREELAELGLSSEIAQCSLSRNDRAGTLRGMHYQAAPHEEVKIVRCTRGAIFDVIVDLRAGSATRGQWFGIELEERRGAAIYVPEGFAHGFQVLADDTDVLYLISHPYVPDSACGVRWDDPALAIEWPAADSRTISDRDRAWPDFTL